MLLEGGRAHKGCTKEFPTMQASGFSRIRVNDSLLRQIVSLNHSDHSKTHTHTNTQN